MLPHRTRYERGRWLAFCQVCGEFLGVSDRKEWAEAIKVEEGGDRAHDIDAAYRSWMNTPMSLMLACHHFNVEPHEVWQRYEQEHPFRARFHRLKGRLSLAVAMLLADVLLRIRSRLPR